MKIAAAKCNRCFAFHPDDAKCYIQPLWMIPAKDEQQQQRQQRARQNIRCLFYDCEATQEEKFDLNGVNCYKHIANLIVCEILCKACSDAGISPETDQFAPGCCCGVNGAYFRHKRRMLEPDCPRLLAFENFDGNNGCPADAFLDFLLSSGNRSTTTICIAHNSGKYDIHLLLEKIYARGIQPKLIMTGLKVYSAIIKANKRRIIFKDSLNFLPGALAGLFDTFELGDCAPSIQKKPHFPHLFNRQRNLNKQLTCLPALKYYSVREMKSGPAKEFLQWYRQHRHTTPFHLRSALVDYCKNDVRLLREACVRFRRTILQIAPEVEPFLDANTIAKLALCIWRWRFLQPNMIINLEGPLNIRQRQSFAALKFFKMLSKIMGQPIRTAEWRIGEHQMRDYTGGCGGTEEDVGDERNFRIDAVIGHDMALEYLGCYVHGCCKCYPDRNKKLAGGKTAAQLLEATQQRREHLERKGMRVLDIWECDFMRMMKRRPAIRKLYNNTFVAPPLDPRVHALRGGRVEPFRLFDHCGPDEVTEHFDIVSLYPKVMKADQYPLGNPVVLTPELLDNERFPCPWEGERIARNLPYRGLLLVRIEPPKQMPKPKLPPFLPYRTTKGNLLFPLCAACAKHTSVKRSWMAAFPDEDIRLALRLGYKVHEVFEVWHWPKWCTGLFEEYINAFLKLKVESSGWPPHLKTEEQKRDFVHQYMVKEMLEVDPELIQTNSGLRHICKLLLNSLWGKLCQRANLTQVALTKSPAEFRALVENDELEVLDFVHLNDQLDRIVYRKKEPFVEVPETNAVHIATFVTSHARRRLFERISEAVDKGLTILYVDTDSLIVKRKKWQETIEVGQFLGDMTSELPPGRHIRSIAIAGPKNYTYLHVCTATGGDEQTVLKIRGFELNYKARARLSFLHILRMILRKYAGDKFCNTRPFHVRIPYVKFVRNKLGFLYTRAMKKTYQPVFEKGVIFPDLSCQPYGYAADENDDVEEE